MSNDEKEIENILTNKENGLLLIIDFEVHKKSIKPNVIYSNELEKEDNHYKLIKYLIHNYYKVSLINPKLNHIYQILSVITKKYGKYYKWLKDVDISKIVDLEKTDFEKVIVFVPTEHEICNRIIHQQFKQETVYNKIVGELDSIIDFLEKNSEINNNRIKGKVEYVIKNLFHKDPHVYDADKLTDDNPCHCLVKGRKRPPKMCYLVENKSDDGKIQFKVNCDNFEFSQLQRRNNIVINKRITYNLLNLYDESNVYEIGLDEFNNFLFIGNYLRRDWNEDNIAQQILAYTCNNGKIGTIVSQQYKTYNLDSVFYNKQFRNNTKLMKGLLVQMFGLITDLQENHQLLHKNLSGNSAIVFQEVKDLELEYYFNIDDFLLKTIIFDGHENVEDEKYESEFVEWIADYFSDVYQEDEDVDVDVNVDEGEEEEGEEEDEDEDDDDEDEDEDEDEYNMSGGFEDEEEEDEVADEDEEEEEEGEEGDEGKEYTFKIRTQNKFTIKLNNFEKSAINIPLKNDNIIRLFNTTIGHKNNTVDEIEFNKYIGPESTYRFKDFNKNMHWFYSSYDTYYFLIGFLLESINNKMFFFNKYFRWIWKTLWRSDEDAKKVKQRLDESIGVKEDKEKRIAKVLEGICLKNNASYNLFLRFYYLYEKRMI